MDFIGTTNGLAAYIASISGKEFMLLPAEHYTFDPEEIDHDYDFMNPPRSGDYVDLLEALGFDHDVFQDAYLKLHDKLYRKAITSIPHEGGEILVTKTKVFLSEDTYYLKFLDQVLTHFDYREDWEAMEPLAKITKRFLLSLKKCPYHHHYNSDIILAAIKDRSAFYFGMYLRQMFTSLWV